MKKQNIPLVLSVFIFMTHSLFAMQSEELENFQALGTLRVLPKDNLMTIIGYVSLHDAISLMSTSTKMLQPQSPLEIWKIFSARIPNDIEPEGDAKNQVRNYYGLFVNLSENYSIPMRTLQFFRTDPVLDSNPMAYNFKIGRVPFRLTCQMQGNEPDNHEPDLRLCNTGIHVIFSQKAQTSCFQANFTIILHNNDGPTIVDHYDTPFLSEKYNKILKEYSEKFSATRDKVRVMGYTFIVEKREE